MGRKNRRDSSAARPLYVGSRRWTESTPRGEWTVQQIAGGSADKAYRCPGCEQLIQPGTGHLVAWREDSVMGVEARRHWHASCWDRAAARR